MSPHFLAPPWNLPGALDAKLKGFLEDEAFDDAVTLLRDVVTPQTREPTWLLLLAYARFRDATEVMFDEQLPASQEALALIDRALALDAPLESVAPLKEAVERALDDASRAELALFARVGEAPGDDVPLADVIEAAFHHRAARPQLAASLFLLAATRVPDAPGRLLMRTHAALALRDAGRHQEARPLLAEALAADWSQPPFNEERALAESAATAALLDTDGGAFHELWQLAQARGQQSKLPFPSVRPNQEALLTRCLAQGDWGRAQALARAIAERPQVSRALQAQVDRALRGPLT
jgi:tetratricopeptide (TPR) repeat protein